MLYIPYNMNYYGNIATHTLFIQSPGTFSNWIDHSLSNEHISRGSWVFYRAVTAFEIFLRPKFKVDLEHKIGNILKTVFISVFSKLRSTQKAKKYLYHHISCWSFRLCGKMQQYSAWVYVKCQLVLILLSGDILANRELFLETWPDVFRIMFYHYAGPIISRR